MDAKQPRDNLAALRQLDSTWADLQSLGLEVHEAGEATPGDAERYSRLLGRAQHFYDALSDLVKERDLFAFIFNEPSLEAILEAIEEDSYDTDTRGLWQARWAHARTAIRRAIGTEEQAIGRLEAQAEGTRKPSPKPGRGAGARPPCPPVIPGTYNGRVTINGEPVPDGTVIVASIGEMKWSRAVTTHGRYVMDVPDHLPTLPPCFEGGAVVFRSGALTAAKRPTWAVGLHNVDLAFLGDPSELEASWDSSRAYADGQALRDLSAGVPATTKGATPEGMAVRPVFRGRQFTLDDSLCFVLMPFDNQLAPVYQVHIRAAVEGEGLTCMRADELFSPGQIMEQIWEQMNRAGLIIADLTGKNPNVFYELGIAHTLGKPVILVTQSEEDVPFDLRHLRFVKYEHTPDGCHLLEEDLRKAVQSVLEQRP